VTGRVMIAIGICDERPSTSRRDSAGSRFIFLRGANEFGSGQVGTGCPAVAWCSDALQKTSFLPLTPVPQGRINLSLRPASAAESQLAW